jgi:hypothetical protein
MIVKLAYTKCPGGETKRKGARGANDIAAVAAIYLVTIVANCP